MTWGPDLSAVFLALHEAFLSFATKCKIKARVSIADHCTFPAHTEREEEGHTVDSQTLQATLHADINFKLLINLWTAGGNQRKKISWLGATSRVQQSTMFLPSLPTASQENLFKGENKMSS